MVLGKGMIGTALQKVDRPDVLFCASGLSNSMGSDLAARQRERGLLQQQIRLHPAKTVVYVSSYSINDAAIALNSDYLQHKRQMENLVKETSRQYLILRTSNVVGRSRQSGNLMNFIYRHICSGESFDVWTQTSRNLIDVEDFADMAADCLQTGLLNRMVYLIHPEDILIQEIVRLFEKALSRKGHYQLVPKGTYYNVDKSLSNTVFEKTGKAKAADVYVADLIHKYFTDRDAAGSL
ncbi:MAG TPA: NAD-dependent epimerase/dehydratase family protein [Arachidicoccus sp.]|nr:NAD-dependent epimerase/dehydratase family protein [Arachidicoccus sp.]